MCGKHWKQVLTYNNFLLKFLVELLRCALPWEKFCTQFLYVRPPLTKSWRRAWKCCENFTQLHIRFRYNFNPSNLRYMSLYHFMCLIEFWCFFEGKFLSKNTFLGALRFDEHKTDIVTFFSICGINTNIRQCLPQKSHFNWTHRLRWDRDT